jgi:hypothetical protein
MLRDLLLIDGTGSKAANNTLELSFNDVLIDPVVTSAMSARK